MIPIDLMQSHDEFINAVKSRLTKLEVQSDVVSTLKGKLDLFNLDIFLSFLPVLAGLLTSKAERLSRGGVVNQHNLPKN
uniref:Uncharacterized protein n=1 Tax=Oryza meridionalis TaxID=40149 RepID=A0A0E0C351_9ORYZ